MLTNEIKNYFKCLIYVFVPITVMLIMMGLFLVLESVITSVNISELFNSLYQAFISLNSTGDESFDEYIIKAISISYIVSSFLTKVVIRKRVASRTLKDSIIVYIIDTILVFLFTTFMTYLYSKFSGLSIFQSYISILVYEIISLFEAYIIHNKGKVKLKEVINFKNIILLYIGSIIIYSLSSLFSYIIKEYTNNLVYFFLESPLYMICLNVVNLNSESYVKYLEEKKELV